MLVLTLCFLFLVTIIWLKIKWTKVKKYWLNKNVPHDNPNPIWGSLSFLMRKNPALWMRRLYKEFRVPYFGIWVFWKPCLVVNCPEISRRILIKDSNNFRNRFLRSGKKDRLGSLNLFTAKDPLWTTVRQRITPMFTSAKLRGFQNMVHIKSNNLKQRIQEEQENGKIIDLRSLFSDYTTDIIGETIFGMKCDATLTGQSHLRDFTNELMKYDTWRSLSYISIFYIPELCDVFGLTFFPKHSTDLLTLLYKEMVKRRGGYDSEMVQPQNTLDVLINIKKEAVKKGQDIDEEMLISQLAVLVQAGFDTTAVIITFAIYELAHQPHLQERLYDELKEAKKAVGGVDFDSNDLISLPYLNAVIDETLRKYPAMGWLDRVAQDDYEIDEKLTIVKGTIVYINAIGMHYDPEYFPDPKLFDPERFLPEYEENIKPYTFMPFGDGPRHCIGKRLAYQNLRFAISNVLLNYEVRPIPGTPKPNDCHIEAKSPFLVPDTVMSVQFVLRP